MRNPLPKFIGGSYNGDTLDKAYKTSGRWPTVFYRASRITLAEHRALKVNDEIMRRHPDDVYDFDGTNYIFRERVNY